MISRSCVRMSALLFVLVSSVSALTAQAGERPSRAALDHAIGQGSRALAAFTERANIPGLQVAVGVDGTIVWSQAFGFADLENRTPATPLTRFRIASVSKALTGTVAARLHEHGRLDLDAPVQRYLPDYPEKQGPVTARLLAGHLSGVRHYRGDETRSAVNYPSLRDALSIFAADPLEHAPGARFTYTTYGYTVLGAMMTEAAGAPDFGTLMRDELFAPLGMRDTVVDRQAALIPNRSGVYVYEDGGTVRNAPLTDHSYKIPGGGFLSTAEDLVRFGSGVLRPGYLQAETLELMFAPMTTADGESTGYGMGWNPAADWHGHRVVGHGGNQPGSRSQLLVYRDTGVVIALVANIRSANFGDDEVMLLAEPFVEAVQGRGPEPATVDPLGRYTLTSADDGQQATIDIWQQGPLVTGVAITPDDHVPLGSVAVSGNEIRCIFADTRLFMLKLTVTGDDVAGELYRGMNTVAFAGKREPPPLSRVAERAWSARRWQQAADAYLKLAAQQPDEGEIHFRLGFALLGCGADDARAAVAFRRAAELEYSRTTALYNVACALARAQDIDDAFTALESALAAGFNQYELLRTDSDLDNLRTDPRFDKLLAASTQR